MNDLLPSQATRAFGAIVAMTGAASVVGAQRLSRWTASAPTARPDVRIIAVLGMRQLVQGALVAVAPDPAMSRIGAAADALHASTMVAAVLLWPAYRRPAALSGALAMATAVAGLRLARLQTDDPR